MVTVIDYGMGNLGSVAKAFEFLGHEAVVTHDKRAVAAAERLVLPGVGAIRDAVENLSRLGLDAAIRDAVRDGVPFLGICLGLQMLFTTSSEGGRFRGLDIIPGEVRRFQTRLKVPHMGWNQAHFSGADPIFSGIKSGEYFYFVHSFHVIPADESVTLCTTDYGEDFVSGIRKDNLVAVQFHPEKSQNAGLRLLENFLTL